MGKAKDIVLKPISSKEANALVKRVHYSGKVVQNSQLHIGVFYHGNLEGAMQFGTPLDKRKMLPLVEGTQWHNMMELNRMAFSDVLPRNSESRAISISMKLLRKHAPQVKWVLSFADGTQCGDGTIYRASGFALTMVKPDQNLAVDNEGNAHHKMRYESSPISTGYIAVNGGKNDWRAFVKAKGWKHAVGYQLRYLYFIDKSWRDRLTVPELPYSEIERVGAGMYKGEKR